MAAGACAERHGDRSLRRRHTGPGWAVRGVAVIGRERAISRRCCGGEPGGLGGWRCGAVAIGGAVDDLPREGAVGTFVAPVGSSKT